MIARLGRLSRKRRFDSRWDRMWATMFRMDEPLCPVVLHHLVAIVVRFRHILGSSERVLSADLDLTGDNPSTLPGIFSVDPGDCGGEWYRRSILRLSARARRLLTEVKKIPTGERMHASDHTPDGDSRLSNCP
jgi:hypothetical protein